MEDINYSVPILINGKVCELFEKIKGDLRTFEEQKKLVEAELVEKGTEIS
jgi:hypothetical protein